jgi:3-phosphoshikimate 1-carboxyvinyltransferase
VPTLRVPGDKSITHRALLLAGLARGESRIRGALSSLDTRATAAALRALGASVSPLAAPSVQVTGRPLAAPEAPLDCGNSGTTARLLCGVLAAQPFVAELTGDASLRRRPMRRVTEPLAAMGAVFEPDSDTLPLRIRGGSLRTVDWTLPVASAQAKSAILLAAAAGRVPVEVREPFPSRDHTERLLRSLGFTVAATGGGVRFLPDGEFRPLDVAIPGDLSSAAFLVGAAVLAPAGEVRVEGVGLNPTRAGFLGVLARMGAAVSVEPRGALSGEPVGDLLARGSRLRATTVDADEVPTLIDEVPLLAVLAACAEGTTVFRGVAELRTKESDRLQLIAENLRALGGAAEAVGDELHVTGSDAPPRGGVRTGGDHRIAMAFAVLGTVRGAEIALDDTACADVSFPGFAAALRALSHRRAS